MLKGKRGPVKFMLMGTPEVGREGGRGERGGKGGEGDRGLAQEQ